MIARGSTRVALALVVVALAGGSLAGCARGAAAHQPAASNGETGSSQTPAPTEGARDSSLRTIQDDLDSAGSASANADGDVADADNSAATSDSP